MRDGIAIRGNVTRIIYSVLPPTLATHLVRLLWKIAARLYLSGLRRWLWRRRWLPDRLGPTVATETIHNLFVTAGRNWVRDALNNDASLTGMTHLAVGTGTTAADPAQTSLVTEVFRGALTATEKAEGKLTVELYLSSVDANGHTLAEAGAFNAAAAGTMFGRAVHTGKPKTVDYAFTYSWEFTISAST